MSKECSTLLWDYWGHLSSLATLRHNKAQKPLTATIARTKQAKPIRKQLKLELHLTGFLGFFVRAVAKCDLSFLVCISACQ